MKEEVIRRIVEKIVNEMEQKRPLAEDMCLPKNHNTVEGILVEASGRHVHLCQEHVEQLFGKGHTLTKQRALSQPGQYVCKERVVLKGPSGIIEDVAVLGPTRKKTQVELSMTDTRALGIKAPVKLSGDLEEAADLLILSGEHSVDAKKSAIVAKIHLHINPADAKRYMVHHGQHVRVKVGTVRSITFNDVIVRVDAHAQNVLHMDYDEANACGLSPGDSCCIDHSIHGREVDQKNSILEAEEFKVVTESRMQSLSAGKDSSLTFKTGTILTPLAQDLARDRHINIKFI